MQNACISRRSSSWNLLTEALTDAAKMVFVLENGEGSSLIQMKY